FESAGRFGELAHHALVVGTLVAHPREQGPPLRGLAVDLRLLGLGFGVQSRQLLLAPLFATLAIGEPVRCPTILSNQTSVQHRQAREVAHRHRARHRVVATQDERQRAALRVHPVHDPEASGERLLLASALPLEPHDLAAECGDVGLRPFDPGREPPDLRLLLPQALLDLLELGEQRRLAGPRGRGLLALLLQALLRLLELLLLALQRLVALLLPLDRPRQRHEHDEQQEDARARAGATTECVATSAASARTAPIKPCIVPCSSSGSQIVVSVAPTRRMISVSARRAWRISVVAVVTVRNAAAARTTPIPSPIVVR